MPPSTETTARRTPSRGRTAALATAVAGAVAVGVVARFVAPSALWLDEAQSVAIARLPVPHLLSALRQDGSPPLYYLLLHVWITVFGTGSGAVRSLSGVFSVLTLPLAWWLARRLAGPRVAVAVLVLLATSPFVIRYATEARMYALLLFLVVLGAAALRAVVRSPGIRPVLALGAVTGAALLTHVWAFHLVAVVGLLAVAGLRARRSEALRVLAGLAVGGCVFAPWVPSLLVQLRHTGTPWAAQDQSSVLPVALGAWQGGPGAVAWTLGIALVLLAVLGLLAVPGGGPGGTVLLRLRPGRSRWGLAALSVGTLVVAATVGALSRSAVVGRYTTVALPAFLALAALGVAALGTSRARAVALTVVGGLGLVVAVLDLSAPRTQAAQVASALRGAAAGDVVVFCPDQLGPSVSRLAPPGLDLVVYPDLRPAGRVDWTDYAQRNTAVPSSTVAARVLRRAGDSAVWVVTGGGFRVPSDARCRDFVQALTEVRGQPRLEVPFRRDFGEGERLERFASLRAG